MNHFTFIAAIQILSVINVEDITSIPENEVIDTYDDEDKVDE